MASNLMKEEIEYFQFSRAPFRSSQIDYNTISAFLGQCYQNHCQPMVLSRGKNQLLYNRIKKFFWEIYFSDPIIDDVERKSDTSTALIWLTVKLTEGLKEDFLNNFKFRKTLHLLIERDLMFSILKCVLLWRNCIFKNLWVEATWPNWPK